MPELWLDIVEAVYGPSEILHSGDLECLKRNVTSLLKTFVLSQAKEHGSFQDCEYCFTRGKIRINAVGPGGMQKSQLLVLGEGGPSLSMNEVFGDPCPGVSKHLHVQYILTDVEESDGQERTVATELYTEVFAEHEPLTFRRRRVGEGKRQSGEEEGSIRKTLSRHDRIPALASAEMAKDILPFVIPFLDVKERVSCRLVGKAWQENVRNWGVTTTIDCSDSSMAPFTPEFFRGILSHSFRGLESLLLSGFNDLAKQDLHPSLLHLTKLRTLDISNCINLDDSTLILLGTHCARTLRVLYLKGCRFTDTGIVGICERCTALNVLDVSYLDITDRSGQAIGNNLRQLKALFLRDNFWLTNSSMDMIMSNLLNLEQITLWGCIGMKRITAFDGIAGSNHKHLAVLNLWGCHSLGDETASVFVGMVGLRTLIVSECHRLSDQFVLSLCQSAPGLIHLQMRYCKLLSDIAVTAVAQSLKSIYSLDVSYCTRISAQALVDLLRFRSKSLFELRLYRCRQLDFRDNFGLRQLQNRAVAASPTSDSFLKVLKEDSVLSVLDLRQCTPFGGKTQTTDHSFPRRMEKLGFNDNISGFFIRKPRWDEETRRRLEQNFD